MLQIYLDGDYRKQQSAVMRVQGLIEHTTIDDVLHSSQIFYDPDPKKTIIPADQGLIDLYNQIIVPGDSLSIKT